MSKRERYSQYFRYAAISIFIVFAGCATRPRTEIVWVNPTVSNQPRQFQIDQGECLALAAQAVPTVQGAPIVLPPSQQAQGSTSTFQGHSSSGGYFQGQIDTRPTNQGWQPSGFLAGMERANQQQATDAALAMQLAPYAMQVRAQREYALACMLKRGWQPEERVLQR